MLGISFRLDADVPLIVGRRDIEQVYYRRLY